MKYFLSPEQAEKLYRWLESHRPFQLLSASQVKGWHNPLTETVQLADGSTIETEVNGLTLDGLIGSIFLDGRCVNVELVNGHWREC